MHFLPGSGSAFGLPLAQLTASFLLVLSQVGTSLGALYPTKPVSSTVFPAGQAAQLKWMEDGHTPLLRDMGPMKIDLYAGNSTYLATLAKDVDPLALSTIVYIPPVLPVNYHVCTLRFVTSKPPQVIYTSDFAVISNPASVLISSSSSSSSSLPAILPTSSIVLSRITGTQPATQPIASAVKHPQDSVTSGFGRWGLGSRLSEGGFVDVEKMKFRMVFIVWPAMIGLSLAL